MLNKKDYEKICDYLNLLAHGLPDENFISKEERAEIIRLSNECFDIAY